MGSRERRISEVEVVAQSSGLIFSDRLDIQTYVEEPLVLACQALYDRNILTWSSSANSKDVGTWGYIAIDKTSLSEANLQICEGLPEENRTANTNGLPPDEDSIFIYFPIGGSSTFQQIETRSLEISNKFVKQPATWVPRYTFEEVKAIYGIKPGDNDYESWTTEDFTGQDGYYYDTSACLFYHSEEHFRKVSEI